MRNLQSFKKYSGLGVAIITPYKGETVDFNGLSEVTKHLVNNKVDFIVALGSTGESNLLDHSEQSSVLKHIIKNVDGRIPVVAGHLADISTNDVIERIKTTDLSGVDALMISAPAYVKPSQEGIFQHYMAIVKESPLPIIIYNVPGRSRCNIDSDTTIRLANSSDKFIGIKEASGDMIQCLRIAKDRPANFFISSGDDELSLSMMANGGEGLISVVANAFPRETSQMIHHALNGDFKTAAEIQYTLVPLYNLLYKEGNPTGIKAAMEILGFCDKNLRLPLVSLSDSTYAELQDEISRFQASFA